MKARLIAVLAITLSIASLESPVRAQTPVTPSNPQEYKVTSDALEGIGDRSAQDDFSQFFDNNISTNEKKPNQTVRGLRLNQSISFPDTSVIVQPAQQSVNGNDGLQVQLDLDNE